MFGGTLGLSISKASENIPRHLYRLLRTDSDELCVLYRQTVQVQSHGDFANRGVKVSTYPVQKHGAGSFIAKQLHDVVMAISARDSEWCQRKIALQTVGTQ